MIEVKNLVFTYPKKNAPTIKDISFKIEPGKIFGFLGPSGSGKSTTQKIIIGILKNYKGSVCVFGDEIRKKTSAYYERIGVVFELPNLYTKFSALENLEYFASLYEGKTEDPYTLLKSVGLADHAKIKVSDFSKGMKMRLNFVRGLLNMPDILFLDEPTSGLDPVNAKKVKDIILKKRNEGKTIFLTTHNMHDAADLCDEVAFIVDGELKLINSPKALMVEHGKRTVRIEYIESGITKSKEYEMKNIKQNEELFSILKEKKLHTIHSQEATLEEIFIQATGRSLV